MRTRFAVVALFVLSSLAVAAAQTAPMRVFIRAGEKTHGPGAHDYPAFLRDWTKLLSDRGAKVQGALRFPTDAELAATDVMILYSGDGGTITPEERRRLDGFLKGGGGLVVLHDGMCGDDAQWFASVAGGAKQHGEQNSQRGVLKMKVTSPSHEIMRGISDFELDDEMFFLLRMAPAATVLATTTHPKTSEVVPQLWAYENTLSGGKPYRSFVSLQGHTFTNFESAPYKELLLRGISWAAKRNTNTLLTTAQRQ